MRRRRSEIRARRCLRAARAWASTRMPITSNGPSIECNVTLGIVLYRRRHARILRKSLPQPRHRFHRCVHRQRCFLPQIKRADVVKSQNVIRMRVCKQNRVQTLHAGAQRLMPEIRRGVDHRIFSVMRQENRWAKAVVTRIGGSAHAAMAGQRGHAHGSAGTKHGKFHCG